MESGVLFDMGLRPTLDQNSQSFVLLARDNLQGWILHSLCISCWNMGRVSIDIGAHGQLAHKQILTFVDPGEV